MAPDDAPVTYTRFGSPFRFATAQSTIDLIPTGSLPPLRRNACAVYTSKHLLLVATVVSLATPASAASLVQVTNFGANPSNLQMHIYVPDRVQARRCASA